MTGAAKQALFESFSSPISAEPNLGSKRLNPLPIESEHEGNVGRFPPWLHHTFPKGPDLMHTQKAVGRPGLQTVCEEARCPNLVECYSRKTATFLAMGRQCTRHCGFCSISHSQEPLALNDQEPEEIARAVQELDLRHVVITMVARDDLQDGGALHLKNIIEGVRTRCPQCTIEVLTSDFQGHIESLQYVMAAQPEVFNHNIETVRRLSPRVRHKATYDRTLEILRSAREMAHGRTRYVKSGFMVGLGETDEEVFETLRDLKIHGVDIVTIGQYLQSSRQGLLVRRFVNPEQFEVYSRWGIELGMAHVYSAPFVRSSYNAHLFVEGGA